jgi:hypothetical protein
MIPLNVQLSDTASPALKTALSKLSSPQPLLAVLGRGLESDLKAHFAAKNQKPNKRGWTKQNFWDRIRNATAFTGATATEATVVIADPAINPHFYGGPIYPTGGKKFLAIPAREEAYGIRPSSGLIPGLRFVPTRNGGMLVQAPVSTFRFVGDKRKGREGMKRSKMVNTHDGGGVFYFLKRSVTIPKDPDALPSREVLQQKMNERATGWAARHLTGGKA